MFRFAHKEFLQALYLLPLIIFFFWWVFNNQKKLLAKFSEAKLLKVLAPEKSRAKYILKSSIFVFTLLLLILALANPQVGTKYEEVKQTGIDVYILLDVSLSMKAEDIKPNRLEEAKHSIANLIQKLRGDRIGLIVFSGEAYVQFPLTTDYAAANLLLNAVNVNTVPQPGTAIGSAIKLATKSFKEEVKTQKVIIAITDGEDHEGDVIDAVKDAVDKNISIYTIGLGSPEGSPIVLYDQNKHPIGYKLDKDNKVVLTRLDESILQQIAREGKGKYYRGSNSENELEMIYQDLSKVEKTEFGTTKITSYEDRFYYLLAPAILLLILEFFISDRKSSLWKKFYSRLGID
ncbi:MAG: VWA domain-containing protein [Bacteroidota bacterium]|nr:VWA domain-containing protein [Bacteroidota bacterium]MDP4190785.1 VWA domain-containing protein [Bacteroidota bacterium]MDP4196404.1 VWA domain-containing protein [Bacteroidota bacterium]